MLRPACEPPIKIQPAPTWHDPIERHVFNRFKGARVVSSGAGVPSVIRQAVFFPTNARALLGIAQQRPLRCDLGHRSPVQTWLLRRPGPNPPCSLRACGQLNERTSLLTNLVRASDGLEQRGRLGDEDRAVL